MTCQGCREGCCREFTVFLSPFDLARLAEAVSEPLMSWVSFLPAWRAERTFRPYAFSLGGKGRFLLVLRRGRGGCPFLQRLRSGDRCRVHASRPAACRCYPFTAASGRLKPLRQMVCPSPWDLSEAEARSFQSDFRAAERDSFQYQARLESWHEAELPVLRTGPSLPPSARRLAFLRFILAPEGWLAGQEP